MNSIAEQLDQIAVTLQQITTQLHIYHDPHAAERLEHITRTIEHEADHARNVSHGHPPVRPRTDLPPGITIGGLRALDAHTAALHEIIGGQPNRPPAQ